MKQRKVLRKKAYCLALNWLRHGFNSLSSKYGLFGSSSPSGITGLFSVMPVSWKTMSLTMSGQPLSNSILLNSFLEMEIPYFSYCNVIFLSISFFRFCDAEYIWSREFLSNLRP